MFLLFPFGACSMAWRGRKETKKQFAIRKSQTSPSDAAQVTTNNICHPYAPKLYWRVEGDRYAETMSTYIPWMQHQFIFIHRLVPLVRADMLHHLHQTELLILYCFSFEVNLHKHSHAEHSHSFRREHERILWNHELFFFSLPFPLRFFSIFLASFAFPKFARIEYTNVYTYEMAK